MANSPLVCYTKISPNTYGKRTHAIDTFVPHVIVGQCDVKRATDIFSGKGYKYSCTYAIGKEGGIGAVLPEEYASICTSSKAADERAITVECASDTYAPYKVTNAVLTSLINLCYDICIRYKKNKVVWIPDKAQNKAYEPKANELKISCHRFYANKSCPGDYIYGLESALAERVNQKLAGQKATPIPTPVINPKPVPAQPVPATKPANNRFDYDNLIFNGTDMKPIYNPTFYYNNYPDIQKALGYKMNPVLLFQHFCTNGLKEARQGIATFNPITYKANYSDLANKYGNDWSKYYQHYLVCGIKEGRKGA